MPAKKKPVAKKKSATVAQNSTKAGFKKGEPRPSNSGRRKGTPNKVTKDFREAVTRLLDSCQDDFILWLSQIDDPKDRFNVVKDLAEYAFPKYARIEMTGGQKEDQPVKIEYTFKNETSESN